MYADQIITINVSAETVWNVLNDFGGVQKWLTGTKDCIADGNRIGTKRKIRTSRDEIIYEQLEGLDHENMTLSYRVYKESLQSIEYLVVISIQPEPNSCTIQWTSSSINQNERISAKTDQHAIRALKDLKRHCELESTKKDLKKIKPDHTTVQHP